MLLSILLVSENLILRMKKENKYKMLDDIMTDVEAMTSEIRIISSEEAMKKLDGLTGIAGFLRWKENYS